MTTPEAIRAAMPAPPESRTPSQLAEETGVDPGLVRTTVRRMAARGELVETEEFGGYRLPFPGESANEDAGGDGAPYSGFVSEPSVEWGTYRDPIFSVVAGAGEIAGVWDGEDSDAVVGYVRGVEALSRPGRRVGHVLCGGDSMYPNLRRGCMYPVLFFLEGERGDVREDDIYFFRLEGSTQFKRLQRLPGSRIRVISDNKAYPPLEVEIGDGTDFAVLGKVLV